MTGKNGNQLMKNKVIDSILFFDSNSSLDELKFLMDKNPDHILISLDYLAYTKLTQENIQCNTSDSYLEKNDFELIQKISYSFSNWGQIEKIKQLFTFEKINLIDLYYRDNIHYFVPIIKKFIEIEKIFNSFPNAKFFASSESLNFINIFSNNVEEYSCSNLDSLNFVSDSVKYNLNIKGNFIPISLSKKNYKKIKSYSEKFINKFFGLKNINSKNNVALLEFDTVKFKKLFSEASNSNVNLILFNRRRPSIWNLDSFFSIKKSRCSVFTPHAVCIDEKKIEKTRSYYHDVISHLKNEKTLYDFFKINGKSLWPLIEKDFLKHCTDRIDESIFEIEITTEFLRKYDIKSVILFHESGFNEQIFIHLAKMFKVKIFVLAHGLGFENDNLSYLEMLRFNRVISDVRYDKILVWGKTQQLFYRNCDVPESKIEIVGSSIYDEYLTKKSPSLSDGYILLATQPPRRHTAKHLTVDNRKKYSDIIKKIAKIVSNLNKKLVVKLHPLDEEIDYAQILGELKENVVIVKQGNIFPLIKKCELFITLDVSTTLLEAQLCNKPAISINVKNWGHGMPDIFKKQSFLSIEIDSLDSTMKKIFLDASFKDELLKKGQLFLDEYISFQGQGSKKLANFLESI